ncbi:hypothetical protein B0T20DRAFT_103904 [Sordaria brevicollis]|uniref:Secreted protein n=1 Tax=Sordaria brevicollis TaxID=83679 RepID=A0AAE0NVR4_SORBR|nr:hypothetical protein B0T20DRAFT_103904 [Sordaria brevicollis]
MQGLRGFSVHHLVLIWTTADDCERPTSAPPNTSRPSIVTVSNTAFRNHMADPRQTLLSFFKDSRTKSTNNRSSLEQQHETSSNRFLACWLLGVPLGVNQPVFRHFAPTSLAQARRQRTTLLRCLGQSVQDTQEDRR